VAYAVGVLEEDRLPAARAGHPVRHGTSPGGPGFPPPSLLSFSTAATAWLTPLPDDTCATARLASESDSPSFTAHYRTATLSSTGSLTTAAYFVLAMRNRCYMMKVARENSRYLDLLKRLGLD
jgi:hypothetical protein